MKVTLDIGHAKFLRMSPPTRRPNPDSTSAEPPVMATGKEENINFTLNADPEHLGHMKANRNYNRPVGLS